MFLSLRVYSLIDGGRHGLSKLQATVVLVSIAVYLNRVYEDNLQSDPLRTCLLPTFECNRSSKSLPWRILQTFTKNPKPYIVLKLSEPGFWGYTWISKWDIKKGEIRLGTGRLVIPISWYKASNTKLKVLVVYQRMYGIWTPFNYNRERSIKKIRIVGT